MHLLLKGGRVIDPVSGFDGTADLYLQNGRVADIRTGASPAALASARVIDISGLVAAPGLVDLHVHLRQPGQTHKEDIASGSRAAAKGGVTTVLAMPNTLPVLDGPGPMAGLLAAARAGAVVEVCQAGSVTVGQKGRALTDFAALRAAGAAALSDDGCPVMDDRLMERAMIRAHALKLPLIDHCEPESEQVLRDIALVRKTGCPVHLAHLSRAESVEAVRAAKREGLPVTAETCPHYFLCTEEAAGRLGTAAKMNPPLAAEADRQAVAQGIVDGTLDIIATDHAPHHPEEKARPFAEAPNGVTGLETLLAAGLTAFYHTGLLSLPQLFWRLSARPARLLRRARGEIKVGARADVVVFDPDARWTVRPEDFVSKGRATPFQGMTLRGAVKMVLSAGRVVVCEGACVI